MALESTKLEEILRRMNRYQSIEPAEEQYKVEDVDEAIRMIRRKHALPWLLQKGSLRVFPDVLEYPVATDHDRMAYLDDSGSESVYENSARFRYTSIQEFYENPDDRNDIAEIWDGAVRYLGVRYNNSKGSSVLLNSAEVLSEWSVSDDATAVVRDAVVTKQGNYSMKVTIVNSTGTATIKNTLPNTQSLSEYQKFYHFKLIYLPSAPTSIQMRLQTDDNNYLYTSVTTQFNGQAFKAGQWNLIAQNLDEATEVGSFDNTSIASEKLVLTGAASGTYYVDASHVRSWTLMDYWYYSKYNVIASGGSVPSKAYFKDSDGVYSILDSLVGDEEWADVVTYIALLTAATDVEKDKIYTRVQDRLQDAWDALMTRYPSLEPMIITTYYRFQDDFTNDSEHTSLW